MTTQNNNLYAIGVTLHIWKEHEEAWNPLSSRVNSLAFDAVRKCKCCNQQICSPDISFIAWVYSWCLFAYKADRTNFSPCENRNRDINDSIAKMNFLTACFELQHANFHPFASGSDFELLMSQRRFIVRLSATESGSISVTINNPTSSASKYVSKRFNVTQDGIQLGDKFYSPSEFFLKCEQLYQ